jgi:hypothetical protein
MFQMCVQRVLGARSGRQGIGAASRVPANGACWGQVVEARGKPEVCGRGRARPRPGSRLPATWREGSGVARKEPQTQRQGRGARAGGRSRPFRRPGARVRDEEYNRAY